MLLLGLVFAAGCTPEPDPIPAHTRPCRAPEHWPEELASDEHPVLIHYRPGEQDMAETVRDLLDESWGIEVDQLGFRPPLPDDGHCGPDDRFDVFLWDGLIAAWVDATAPDRATPYDDWYSMLAIDPWGPYGGDILDGTVAHEFNHACQAADDWRDTPIVYEMTSTWIEEVVMHDHDWISLLPDLQRHPEWSLDRDDGYETWYMYATALYLHFLQARYFDGDPSFVADMWFGMRNPPGASDPDFEDSIDALLADHGSSYADSVVEFARWRWYTADHDDGAHFDGAGDWPADTKVAVTARMALAAAPVDRTSQVMAYGSAYFDLSGGALRISLVNADPTVEWVAQVVPGAASDGDRLTLPATVDATTPRTLVITALPVGAAADPEARTDALYRFTVHVEAP